MDSQERDLLMWQSGYDYAMQRVANAADDIPRCPPMPKATLTHEQRVAERMALLNACAVEIDSNIGFTEWDDAETILPGTLT